MDENRPTRCTALVKGSEPAIRCIRDAGHDKGEFPRVIERPRRTESGVLFGRTRILMEATPHLGEWNG